MGSAVSEARASGKLTVLTAFSGEGGVERMVLNLVNGIAERGFDLDLVLTKRRSLHTDSLHPQVRLLELNRRHTATSLFALRRYLLEHRPECMLVAKDRVGRLAVRARALAGTRTRLVLRLGTNLSAALEGRAGFRRWLRTAPMRRLYPALDGIVAVSQGVAEDVVALSGVAPERVRVVRNPVITPRLHRLAAEEPPHPWLRDKRLPVVLGAGRLTRQKDFPTLIRGFAALRERVGARLIILGRGSGLPGLRALAGELGVGPFVDFPGFAENPYAFMAHSDLFVLSSRWEGSPNVLTEAMALGTPVVSTDCPSGPRELLARGRVAPLVPVGDWSALAARMEQQLAHPANGGLLRHAVRDYTLDTSVAGYLDALGLSTGG